MTDILLWFIAVMAWRISEWEPIDMTVPARMPFAHNRFTAWMEKIQ